MSDYGVVQRPVEDSARGGSGDSRVLLLFLAPGLVVAGLLYLGGARELAFGLAATVGVVATLLSPEVGLYLFCLWEALDVVVLEQEGRILTPGKVIGPLVLLAYALHPGRVRTPMLLSRPFVASMALLGLYGLVTALWALAPLAAARYGAQIAVQALLVGVAVHRLSERRQIGRALLFTVLGGGIAAAILLIGGTRSARYTRATIAEFANPNTTALGLSAALMCVPLAWYFVKQKWLRLALAVAAPVIMAAMMQTGSRSQLVAVLLAAPPSLLLVRRAGVFKRLAIPAVCTAALALTMYYVLSSGILGRTSQERLQELVERRMAAKAEARTMIYPLALRAFLSQPWGFGFGNTGFALERAHGIFIDVHSTLLAALVDGGVVSLALFTYGMWVVFRSLRRIPQGGLGILAMTLFVFTLLSCVTHTIHYSKYFWVPLLFCVVAAEYAQREHVRQSVPGPRAAPVPVAELLRRLGPADAVVY